VECACGHDEAIAKYVVLLFSDHSIGFEAIVTEGQISKYEFWRILNAGLYVSFID